MTHFTVMAIVSAGTKDVREFIASRMADWQEDQNSGFWDWYRIGGRWNGELIGKPRSSDDGFNFGDEFTHLEENSIRATEWLAKKKKFFPSGVLTPCGSWEAIGEFGWWGSCDKKHTEKAWKAKVKKLVSDAVANGGDPLLVLLDVHI